MIKRTDRPFHKVNISPAPGINREADFRRYVFVYGIIEDVPWDEDESEAFDGNIEALKEAVELGLNRRGEQVVKIPFNDDRWHIDDTTFVFEDLPAGLEVKVRKFVLFQIINHNWKAYATINGYLRRIRRFFTMYGKANPDFIFNYIHSSDIRRFFDGSGLSSSTKSIILFSLTLFFQFIKNNYKKEYFSMDMDDLNALKNETDNAAAAVRTKREYPTIPDRLFYQIHFKCMDLIRDAETPFDDKVIACMIIIFLWTGLRKKEVRLLRRHCLMERKEEDTVLQFYEYRSPKNRGRVSPCLLFPAALEALRVLEELQTRHDAVSRTDYLISLWNNMENKPESSESIQNSYDRFCIKHLSDICSQPFEGMSRVCRRSTVIYRPSFYCFRVHLCTYLIDHGYDERWVEGHLGHISSMIRGKYYRMRESTRSEMHEDVKAHLPSICDTVTSLTQQLSVNVRRPDNPFKNIINNL